MGVTILERTTWALEGPFQQTVSIPEVSVRKLFATRENSGIFHATSHIILCELNNEKNGNLC